VQFFVTDQFTLTLIGIVVSQKQFLTFIGTCTFIGTEASRKLFLKFIGAGCFFTAIQCHSSIQSHTQQLPSAVAYFYHSLVRMDTGFDFGFGEFGMEFLT
jgi:hypothetical protein